MWTKFLFHDYLRIFAFNHKRKDLSDCNLESRIIGLKNAKAVPTGQFQSTFASFAIKISTSSHIY